MSGWTKGGKLITDDAGKVIDCDYCPCCPCPCADWSAQVWPCENLLQTYLVTISLTERATEGGVGPDGPYHTWATSVTPQFTVTADPANPCTWTGTASTTYTMKNLDGTDCDPLGPIDRQVTLKLKGTGWYFEWEYGSIKLADCGELPAPTAGNTTNTPTLENHVPRCDWNNGNGWRSDQWGVAVT